LFSSGGNRKTLVKVWAIRLALEFVTPTEDGRCVSLLKILLTNFVFTIVRIATRKSNDIQRAAFTVDEVVDLTINFTEEIISKVYF
jgi:predicted DNA-binding helix-hairpin-helix protein